MVKTIFNYSIAHLLCRRYIIKYLGPKREDKILDAGCGIGFINDEIARYTDEAVGIDLNADSIDFAKKNMRGKYLVSDVTQTPFPENHFDKIISCAVLEHIKKPETMIEEIYRITKKRGHLIIAVPCSSGILNGTFLNKCGHDELIGGEYHFKDGFYYWELNKILERAGFKVQKKKYFNFLLLELILELSKFYSFKIKKIRYRSQTDLYPIQQSIIFKVYSFFSPLFYHLVMIEDIFLARFLRGHALIIDAIKE